MPATGGQYLGERQSSPTVTMPKTGRCLKICQKKERACRGWGQEATASTLGLMEPSGCESLRFLFCKKVLERAGTLWTGNSQCQKQ